MIIGAVDVGGTKIAAGLVDSAGRLLAGAQFPTQASASYASLCQQITHLLQTLSEKHSASVAGIGLGSTGRVDAAGVFLKNTFLPALEGHNLAADLGAAFGVAGAVENDADAAALGEYRWGSGQGSRRMIFVTVSTGIGGGILLDGELYRGVDGCHPEIGHHVLDPGGPACFCGARGCWERLASGTALAAFGRQSGGERYSDARAICDLADAGDAAALRLVEREGFYLGLGLANLITLFAPDCIVLGGGLMARWDLFVQQAQAVIRTGCGLVPWQKTRLAPAGLGSQAGLLGAAAVWASRPVGTHQVQP